MALIARHGADWFRARGLADAARERARDARRRGRAPRRLRDRLRQPAGRPAARAPAASASARRRCWSAATAAPWLDAQHMQRPHAERGRSAARRRVDRGRRPLGPRRGILRRLGVGARPGLPRRPERRPVRTVPVRAARHRRQLRPRSPAARARTRRRARLRAGGPTSPAAARAGTPTAPRASSAAPWRSSRARSTATGRAGAPACTRRRCRCRPRPGRPHDQAHDHPRRSDHVRRPRAVRRAAARAHPPRRLGLPDRRRASRSRPSSSSSPGAPRPPARRSPCCWRPAVTELADRPADRGRRARPDASAGIELNELLTSSAAALLTILLIAEGITILDMQRPARPAHVHRAGADPARRCSSSRARATGSSATTPARPSTWPRGRRSSLLRAARPAARGDHRDDLRHRRLAAAARPPLRPGPHAPQGRRSSSGAASSPCTSSPTSRARRARCARAWATARRTGRARRRRGVTAALVATSLCAGLVLALVLLSHIGAWHRDYGF